MGCKNGVNPASAAESCSSSSICSAHDNPNAKVIANKDDNIQTTDAHKRNSELKSKL